jgi:heterotetrameric sarcosine oxidase gamma subunit
MTEYNPTFRNPITMPRPTTTSTFANVTPALGVSDLTGAQVTLIQGDAGDILARYFPAIPARAGDLAVVGQGLLARLTPSEFYLFGKSPATRLLSAAQLDDSFKQAGHFAHATDFTHGKAVLKLAGPAAAEALSKICGLDFHDTVFPNMRVRQTSAAKIKTLIARCDDEELPAYFLHVDRALGQYFFETIWDAGQEFGIVSII